MSAPFPKCLFLACCLLLGAAPSAFAGTVQLSGSTLTYSAAAGEANRVTITAGASSISVNEVGPGVTAGTGCSSTGPSSASCQADGVTAISVSTGDGNDTARVNGWLPATFYDGPGNDTMTGGSGQDTFVSGTGADVLKGGIGYDTADYSARTAPLTVSLDGVANDGEAGEGDNVQTDVEVVTGGAGGDTLDGGLGADDLYGGAGNDTADYSPRRANVAVRIDDQPNDGQAGEGDNVHSDVENVTGGSGDDRLVGSAGANDLIGGPGDDVIDGGPGPDVMAGGPGTDTVDYSSRTSPLSVSLDDRANDGEAGEGDDVLSAIETLRGGRGADHLVGNGASNTLTGGPGDDTLEGGAGDDLLVGEAGRDRLVGGAGRDRLDGGADADTILVKDRFPDVVRCGASRDSVSADAKKDRLSSCEAVLSRQRSAVSGPTKRAKPVHRSHTQRR